MPFISASHVPQIPLSQRNGTSDLGVKSRMARSTEMSCGTVAEYTTPSTENVAVTSGRGGTGMPAKVYDAATVE